MTWLMIQLQTATSSVSLDEAVELVNTLIAATRSGNWALVVGLSITLLVAGARALKLLNWLPKSAVKWVAAGLAVLGSVATHLIAGDINWVSMVVTSLSMGATAIGGWEMLLKPLVKKLQREEEE